MKYAILMTCYNRAPVTLKCLEYLYACSMPDNGSFDVWLVDDASPDQTGALVKSQHPQVNVIQGSGDLYWCGGMRLAWQKAAGAYDYDGYIWLNDDTLLKKDALVILHSTLLSQHLSYETPGIVVGAICSSCDGTYTYGGTKNGKYVIPNGAPQSLDTMNGNAVLVTKGTFHRLGGMPKGFRHASGDTVYSRRATKSGVPCILTGGYIAMADREKERYNLLWRDQQVPLLARLRYMHSPKGQPPLEFYRVVRIDTGVLGSLWAVIKVYVRCVFPSFNGFS